MSVAEMCGVADHDAALMSATRAAWPQWRQEDPGLPAVADLLALRAWTCSASPHERGNLFAALASRARQDQVATTALVWLLIPGAQRRAALLADLSPHIDVLVAGQLWIEAAEAWRWPGPLSAGSILGRVRSAVCVELGVGAAAKRRDRAWASAVPTAEIDQLAALVPEVDPSWQVTELLMEATTDHAIVVFDAWLIGELARVAAETDAPAHRGRQGLTTPAVVDRVGEQVGLSTRTLRRRTSKALDRLAEYVAVRDDPTQFAVWKARHPASLTPQEEMELVITDGAPAHWIRSRAHAPAAGAGDVPTDRQPGTG